MAAGKREKADTEILWLSLQCLAIITQENTVSLLWLVFILLSQVDSGLGAVTQAVTLVPLASQLAFVGHISAWLTSELSVGGARLCPDSW